MPYSLFSVFGIEIEYMIVDKQSLNIKPITDQLIEKINGSITDEVPLGAIAVNNELALHVVELKTNGPVPSLENLDTAFHEGLITINNALDSFDAQCMPTAMHPWFDPSQNPKLWPYGNKEIYNLYHKIFDCRGHGWTNLQSMHINLPFANDKEFVALHEAIRPVLPLIPGIAASSPFVENQLSNFLDYRLATYEKNQKRIPIITGQVIPESVDSIAHYQDAILTPIYQAIAPHDPQKILQYEWLNSRGAIARFERDAIEIRVIDSQESPLADISVAYAVTTAIKHLVESEYKNTHGFSSKFLKSLLDTTIKTPMREIALSQKYASLFPGKSTNLQHVWSNLIEHYASQIPMRNQKALEHILNNGSLSERLIQQFNKGQPLISIYTNLCECLKKNNLFV